MGGTAQGGADNDRMEEKHSPPPPHRGGYTAEGMGVARLEGRVVFVPFTAQGELWRVRLEKVRPQMAWGRGVELLEPSRSGPNRTAPVRQVRRLSVPAPHLCRGAAGQGPAHRRRPGAGGRRQAEPAPVLGAEEPDRYRNKVQFPVAPGRRGPAVGYYRPRSHNVLDVDDCLLQPEMVTTLRLAFLGWMEDFHVPPMRRRPAPA